jgi:hypothetical protein
MDSCSKCFACHRRTSANYQWPETRTGCYQGRRGVKATVSFDAADTPNCGIRINWGDGQSTEIQINQTKDVPAISSHTYAKAGNFNVMVEGKKAGNSFKCSGKNISKTLAVAALSVASVAPVASAPKAAAPATPASAPAAAKAVSLCPEGWTLAKPGQNAKTKAFTCTAKAGTKIPEPKLSCPGDLTYFDNSKKGQLGCRI